VNSSKSSSEAPISEAANYFKAL